MPRRRYGWIRSPHDERDHHFAASPHVLAALPAAADLESLWQGRDVYDQGPIGSCGPNSAAGDIIAAYLPHGLDFLPSRLFIYWVTRYLMGTVNQDSGVDNRTMLKALAQFGWPNESLCPYVVNKFTAKPSDAAFRQAATRKIDTYLRVPQTLEQMKGCLAGGDPFIFGFTCFPSLESSETAETGLISMPGSREQVIGGHDVVFCGYDDAAGRFKLRNSWGRGWGLRGYGWIPTSMPSTRGLPATSGRSGIPRLRHQCPRPHRLQHPARCLRPHRRSRSTGRRFGPCSSRTAATSGTRPSPA